MRFNFAEGGIMAHGGISKPEIVIETNYHDYGSPSCRHARKIDETDPQWNHQAESDTQFVVPRVVFTIDSHGWEASTACIDCIMEAAIETSSKQEIRNGEEEKQNQTI